MSNILDSYLVSLGFSVDEPSFNKFRNLIADADKQVTEHTSGIVKHMLEAQASIVGAFTSLSAAIIGVVDKVAMADQGYRLLGLRMLMTTDSARKMDMITKTLGASLAEIVWDKELHERAIVLSKDMDRYTGMLGKNFEQQMRGIRDIRFELSRLEVAGRFLGMKFTQDLFTKLGLGDVGDRIRRWVDDITSTANLKRWSDELSTYAIPILRDTISIVKELGGVVKEGALAFTNLVGLFTGDSSIQGTEFSFKNLAGAIHDVSVELRSLLHNFAETEKFIAHMASGLSLLASGNFKDAATEFQQASKDSAGATSLLFPIGPGSSDRGPSSTPAERPPVSFPGSTLPPLPAPPLAHGLGHNDLLPYSDAWWREFFSIPGLHHYETKSDVANRLTAAGTAKSQPQTQPIIVASEKKPLIIPVMPMPRGNTPLFRQEPRQHISQRTMIEAAVAQAASRFGIQPALALAVAKHESGFNPNATNRNPNGTTDWGVMQLNDKTIQTLGVRNPLDARENIEAGVGLLARLMRKYHGDQVLALSAYSAGEGRVDKTPSFAQMPPVTRKAVPEILEIERQYMQKNTIAAGAGAGAAARDPETVGQSLAGPLGDAIEFVVRRFSRPNSASPKLPSVTFPVNGDVEADRVAPRWLGTIPRFMHESPVWYGVAPKWLTQTPEGDSSKPSDFPVGLPAWMAAPLLPLPADMQPQIRLFQQAQRTPAPVPQNHQHTTTIDYGGVQIYVTEPGANLHQIRRAVVEELDSHAKRQIQTDLSQLNPLF